MFEPRTPHASQGDMYEMNLRTYFVIESVGDRSRPAATGEELDDKKKRALLSHYDCARYGKGQTLVAAKSQAALEL